MSSILLPNSKIDNIKMVIFDKDGTLIDIHHYWCSMIEFRAEFFVKKLELEKHHKLYTELIDAMGIDLKTKKMKAEGPVGIKPRNFIIDIALKTIQKYDANYTKEMVEDIFKKVDEYSKLKLHTIVKALPEVERVLKDLKKANIKISIATTDLTIRATLAMKSLSIENYFDDIIGADLVEKAKPNPDLIEYILEKNNLKKENIIVVGDSMADFGMANNAKCKFIGVKSGLYTDEFVKNSMHLIDNLISFKVTL